MARFRLRGGEGWRRVAKGDGEGLATCILFVEIRLPRLATRKLF
jgi:hypothetical protein